ncbi:MAG: HIT family protein [Ktedonobacterales bacterium]
MECVFYNRDALSGVLSESAHFLLLADHAPLVEGHLLIIPRAHYACYGAVPVELEPELLALKRRVADFLARTYRVPAFFEHGVFRQTVYHAHLHAIPLGATGFRMDDLLAHGGHRVASPADVRDWYAAHGHYFYIEQPDANDAPAPAAVFPPEEQRYFRALGMLRDSAGRTGGWAPQPVRRLSSGPKVASVIAAWARYASKHPDI